MGDLVRWLASLALTLFSLGCGSDSPVDPPQADAGTSTACLTRCPLAEGEGERCEACYENVGRCCYPETPDIDGHIPGMAHSCRATAGCAACCDECAAMSCEDMLANHNCPFTEYQYP